jgi:allantoate deiminase
MLAHLPAARASAAEAIRVCRVLSACSEEQGSTTRMFLGQPMQDVHARLGARMSQAGMTVSVDGIGNLRGFYRASTPGARRLLIGSHLDTVPHAGAFDGVLGVVLGIMLVESLERTALPFAIEVVGFSEEEGVRYGVPFLGSRAVAGTLSTEMLTLCDVHGRSVSQAVRDFGLDPEALPRAVVRDALGYLELHIEQGPVLDSIGRPLGIVERIVGQTRAELTFTGTAGHAGTTPMSMRRDALACAAEWMALVEQQARATPGLVATIGRVSLEPGASNVIAGRCVATLDVRHGADGIRRASADRFVQSAREIAGRRQIDLRTAVKFEQDSIPMDPGLTALLERAATLDERSPPPRLSSGGGHDAGVLAARMPAAMLFLRSPGGCSHQPSERVLEADVAAALCAGRQFLGALAASSACP